MTFLAKVSVVAAMAASVAAGQIKNGVGERGMVQPDQPRLTRGPGGKTPGDIRGEFTGILVDAGCHDRSLDNLRQPPLEDFPLAPGGKTPERNANAMAEQAGAMAQQTADERGRQPDLSCAISGNTRAVALLMPNGRLVNLDPGGVTDAMLAVQGTPEGQAMLEGKTPGLKPRAKVKGSIHEDRLTVERLTLVR